jgi:hypothetical protein
LIIFAKELNNNRITTTYHYEKKLLFLDAWCGTGSGPNRLPGPEAGFQLGASE